MKVTMVMEVLCETPEEQGLPTPDETQKLVDNIVAEDSEVLQVSITMAALDQSGRSVFAEARR